MFCDDCRLFVDVVSLSVDGAVTSQASLQSGGMCVTAGDLSGQSSRVMSLSQSDICSSTAVGVSSASAGLSTRFYCASDSFCTGCSVMTVGYLLM
jgi:hypothetical protein